ncbi:MAG: SCO family protein [Thermomicrobiales bacterium]|nr:SCO family protein [Thermomicrobiales bacterium]
MSRKLALAVIGVAAIAIVAGLIWQSRGEEYAFAGGEITPARAAAPIDLIDQNGQPFSLDSVKGDVVLVYFGYTTCPDLCPTTLSDFTAIKTGLGDEADKVKFVMVTIDPERDTTARLFEYLGFFDADFVGLRGEQAQLEPVMQAYGVVANRVEYPESATKYLMDHTSLIYLIDPDGRLRVTYAYGTDPALIEQDVRHFL